MEVMYDYGGHEYTLHLEVDPEAPEIGWYGDRVALSYITDEDGAKVSPEWAEDLDVYKIYRDESEDLAEWSP